MADSGLIVEKAGLATTVQDRGRPGYRDLGVPIAGAADRGAFDLANALLGNDPNAAALELAMLAGVYRSTAPLALALSGAPFVTWLRSPTGDRSLTIPCSFTLHPDDLLIFGPSDRGMRGYLAVAGGWQTPLVLGSRSSETPLVQRDLLPARSATIANRRPVNPPVIEKSLEATIRVLDGPDGPAPDGLLLNLWRVTPESNRVGMRLIGPGLPDLVSPDRLSAPVAPGAIQIADGQPMIIGVAGGTMGGYPHVAHVISADLDLLAQIIPGVQLRFQRVSLEEAIELDCQRRRELALRDRLLRVQCVRSEL